MDLCARDPNGAGPCKWQETAWGGECVDVGVHQVEPRWLNFDGQKNNGFHFEPDTASATPYFLPTTRMYTYTGTPLALKEAIASVPLQAVAVGSNVQRLCCMNMKITAAMSSCLTLLLS